MRTDGDPARNPFGLVIDGNKSAPQRIAAPADIPQADSRGRFCTVPVGDGFLEYALKDIRAQSQLLGEHQRYYCPRPILQVAETLYSEAIGLLRGDLPPS